MMTSEYRQWLEHRKYHANTIAAQMHRAGRVEEWHGDLDEHYQHDQLASLIQTLSYSADDRRSNRPNPSKIPIEGDLYNNLASYRDAVKRHSRFRAAGPNLPGLAPVEAHQLAAGTASPDDEGGQRIGLERDMQAALRSRIEQLEEGLSIVDDGAERSVDSGFIDITARDASGATVVIELKTGVAGQRAIAQILSYMGDMASEQDPVKVRGILVASDFDSRAKAAARMVPDLILRKYSVRFAFSDGNA